MIHWIRVIATLLAVLVLQPRASSAQEKDPLEDLERLLALRTRVSSYSQFLRQAEGVMGEKNGDDTARRILNLCPKELRHFEWHYLHNKVSHKKRVLKGHKAAISGIDFSPDGKTIASASEDETVKLWDVATGAQRLELKGHDGRVLCVAFHPNGKTLATGGSDTTVKIWDAKNGRIIATIAKHKRSVAGVAFSPDGAWLASYSRDRYVHVQDLAKGKTQADWNDSRNYLTCLAFSPDSKYLALGGSYPVISLLRAPEFRRERNLEGHQREVAGLVFQANGQRLVSAGLQSIQFFDVDSGKLLRSTATPREAPFYGFAGNRQGTALVTIGKAGTTRVWYAPFEKPGRTVGESEESSSMVAFHPDGLSIAIQGADDSTIELHDTGEDIALFQAAQPIWSVHPGNERFLVSMRVGVAALVADGGQAQTLKGHRGQVRAICLNPQGTLLASAGLDRLVKIWDATGTKELHSLSGHKALIRSLAFSPDGKQLASASEDKTIKIWNAVAGKEVLTLTGHTGIVTSIVYHPKADILVSAGGDGTIRLWNATTGKLQQTWKAHDDLVSHLALTADGKTLASAGTDDKIKIWDVGTAQTIFTLKAMTGMVQGLSFSPDGKRLASGAMGGGVTLWDTQSGQAVYTFARPAGPINAVAFSPDAIMLFSGSYDGTVMRWKARPME